MRIYDTNLKYETNAINLNYFQNQILAFVFKETSDKVTIDFVEKTLIASDNSASCL